MANEGRYLSRSRMFFPLMFEPALIAETGDYVVIIVSATGELIAAQGHIDSFVAASVHVDQFVAAQ